MCPPSTPPPRCSCPCPRSLRLLAALAFLHPVLLASPHEVTAFVAGFANVATFDGALRRRSRTCVHPDQAFRLDVDIPSTGYRHGGRESEWRPCCDRQRVGASLAMVGRGEGREHEVGGGDMAYVRENLERQMDLYNSIRRAGGRDVVNDVYVRDPRSTTFWYVGKVARCTGTVSLDVAVARQWNLIEEHAARLRPVELGRGFGTLEIWCAPGDSELDMSVDDGIGTDAVGMRRMERAVPGSSGANRNEMGFAAEFVTNRGEGFRVERPNADNRS